ncbi:hypothetical protein [Roseinatronobacter sp.]|uniref:hypothetical protein n=1 Tax=Roseinatronobacter sp. TaxID=1945755 RepID=UPI003F7109AE
MSHQRPTKYGEKLHDSVTTYDDSAPLKQVDTDWVVRYDIPSGGNSNQPQHISQIGIFGAGLSHSHVIGDF